eukprot:scaffold17774_cov117-Skeletonema_dohrnii-CCMP3373.AAC.2
MGKKKPKQPQQTKAADAANVDVAASDEALREKILKLEKQLEDLNNNTNNNNNNNFGFGLGEVVAPPEKSGYLFKWQDRSIGWGGTKWGLRFVRLTNGQLSYYKSHEDKSPSGGEGGDKNEVGGSFHVFSVYQRPIATVTTTASNNNISNGGGDAQGDDEEEIIPLLRFSTQSLAEKTQWMTLISQSCAYCDSEEFAIQQQFKKEEEEALLRSPNNKRGTLPNLIFETPTVPLRSMPSGRNLTNMMGKSPSGRNLTKMGKAYMKKSGSKDAAHSNKIQYPPSKPMHRQASPSYLSDGAHPQNYRGMFNLLIIILVISNFRLLLDTVSKHGFILDELRFSLQGFSEGFSEAPLDNFPFISGLLVVQLFVVFAYLIEKALSKRWVSTWFGMLLHIINTNATLVVVIMIVWYHIQHPIVGAGLVMQATITWMKLISYNHANSDYRQNLATHKATLALVKDLDEEGLQISYPMNITLKNIYYFWFAPTLTYQIAFPRTPYIRWGKVVTHTLHLFISATLVAFLAAQVVAPNLDLLIKDLEANGKGELRYQVIADYLLKLSITSTYIWLLGFYGFFHCFMNLTAELLRFGDRVFYQDWWNAREVSAYWRLWNMPVHYWLVRHLYFPSVRVGLSKTGATFVVFFFSAILHEVLISVPCHNLQIWSFLAMMGQLPLIFITKMIDKRMPNSSVGNFIFWISFCFIGQPMAMLLYTIDYWEHNQEMVEVIEEKTPKLLATIASIFGASSKL